MKENYRSWGDRFTPVSLPGNTSLHVDSFKSSLTTLINRNILSFVFLFLFLLSNQADAQSYEAESGSLLNGANIQGCSSCSGTYQVGFLGGNLNGACAFTINVDAEGDFGLNLSYASADQRSVFITVNNIQSQEIVCQPSGGWQTIATANTLVNLHAGSNTIRFDNRVGWAPNIDKFTLTPGLHYTLSGSISDQDNPIKNVVLKLTGGSSRTTTTDENGYYEFKDLPGNRSYTITPQMSGKVFYPVYHHYEILNDNKTVQNFSAVTQCGDCRKPFSFGGNGEIIYDTQTGMTTVTVNGNEFISNAHAVVSNGEKILTSTNYTNRSIVVSDIQDDFGTGKKVMVSLTADDLPDMQQVFYTYANRNYFLAEVSISGPNVSSNYMAPLVCNNVILDNAEDTRVISMPFDNDTFIRYSSKSMANSSTVTSSEVTAFYDNNSRMGLVVGSVEHMHWKTGVKLNGLKNTLSSLTVWGGYADVSITRDAIHHGSISGQSVKSPKVFVGLFEDWRLGLEEYGKANALAEPRYVFNWTAPTPVGWNSWGVIQDKLTLEKAKSVVNFFAHSLPGFRNDDTAFIDLDSFWDNMVQGGLEGDFAKLTEFVNYCKANGLKPGIYWGPFVDWGKYNRKVEGSTYQYADAWTSVNGKYHELDGGRAMDPTHPATQERIKYVIGKFKNCGFKMIKIDFIGHASIEADHFYDPTVKTGMQAFQKGMEYLVNELNGKMLIYAAISPNLATGRYVHVRRIACDAFADIQASEYTLNSTTYGWWQTYVYNYVDADHVVFKEQSIGENRARLTSAVINGTILNGDDFSKSGPWTAHAIALLQNQKILDIIKNGKAFMPVEGNTEMGASEMFEKQIGEDYYLAIVNYSNEKIFDINLNRLAVKGSDYAVKELYSNTNYSIQGTSLTIKVGGKDAAVLKFSKEIINAVQAEVPGDTAMFYPNPASQRVKVICSNIISSIKLSSVNGKVLMEIKNIKSDNYLLDLTKQSAGVYLITLTDSGGSVKSYRIIKE